MNVPRVSLFVPICLSRQLVLAAGCSLALLSGGFADVAAQVPLPTTAPVSSPDPAPTPAPVLLDLAALRPQSATVQLVAPGNATSASSSAGITRSSSASLLSLLTSSPDLFAPTGLTAQPQAAVVTLSYGLVCVGAKVLVAPLDGGTLNGTPGGKTLTVALDGTLTFSFQAPASPGCYHVVAQLGNAQMALPFEVATTSHLPAGN